MVVYFATSGHRFNKPQARSKIISFRGQVTEDKDHNTRA